MKLPGALFALLFPFVAHAQVGLPFPGPGHASSGGSSLSCSYTPVTTGTQGTVYTGATPSASGGTPSYTFSETGSLPTGVSISSSTGIISGTPSVSGSFGPIQVSVTDSASHTANCGSAFTLVISSSVGPPVFTYQGLPSSSSNPSSNTFTATYAVGTASASRIVYVIGAKLTDGETITSANFNGSITATITTLGSGTVGNNPTMLLFSAIVPTGTTAVLNLTASGTIFQNVVSAAYTADSSQFVSTTPVVTFTNGTTAATALTTTASPAPASGSSILYMWQDGSGNASGGTQAISSSTPTFTQDSIFSTYALFGHVNNDTVGSASVTTSWTTSSSTIAGMAVFK